MFIFHTDDVSLPSSWLHFQLVEANFPHSLTNQKHYTDLGRLVMHHQNRISALASHRSFHRESSDNVTKCWLFSQAPRLFQGFHWCTNSFRFSSSGNYYVQTSSLKQTQGSFSRIGAKLYNAIPNEICQLSKGAL